MMIERPTLDGKTPEENIAIIDTWIARTADTLNYMLRHIGRENMDIDVADKSYVDQKLAEQYRNLRAFAAGRSDRNGEE